MFFEATLSKWNRYPTKSYGEAEGCLISYAVQGCLCFSHLFEEN